MTAPEYTPSPGEYVPNAGDLVVINWPVNPVWHGRLCTVDSVNKAQPYPVMVTFNGQAHPLNMWEVRAATPEEVAQYQLDQGSIL